MKKINEKSPGTFVKTHKGRTKRTKGFPMSDKENAAFDAEVDSGVDVVT